MVRRAGRSYKIVPVISTAGSVMGRACKSCTTVAGERAVATVRGSPRRSMGARMRTLSAETRPSAPSSVPSRSVIYNVRIKTSFA